MKDFIVSTAVVSVYYVVLNIIKITARDRSIENVTLS